jgi:hypothetical protein
MAGLHRARAQRTHSENRLKKAGKAMQEGYDRAINTYSGVANEYKPYMDFGKEQIETAGAIFRGEKSIQDSPGYSYRFNEGQAAIENSAAAKGNLFGGRTLLELTKFGQEFASNELDKMVQRSTQVGMPATQAYDAAKANEAEMQIGKSQAQAGTLENLAQISTAESKFGAGMFSSWFSGSGPFGQMTAKACYIAAYHFGPGTEEHRIIAEHVHKGETWKAKLAGVIYTLLRPLFVALLKEARK